MISSINEGPLYTKAFPMREEIFNFHAGDKDDTNQDAAESSPPQVNSNSAHVCYS